MKFLGILLLLLGAVAVYGSLGVKKLFFPGEKNEKTYDGKENLIKLIGVVIAIIGILLVMFAQ